MVVIIIVVCLPDSNKQQTRQPLEAAWNAVDTQYYFVSITFSNDIWFDSSSPKIVVFGLDLLAALWLPTRNVQVDHMIAGLTEQVWAIGFYLLTTKVSSFAHGISHEYGNKYAIMIHYKCLISIYI